MKPASHHHSLPLLLLFLLSATSVGNEFRALARSPSLPLIKTLLDHGPLKPSMAAKHELSLQHLRFMLDLYRRSADGDGRPRTGHQAGAAVRLVRPLKQASFKTGDHWHTQTFMFNLYGLVQSQPPSPDPGFKDEIKKMEWPVFLPPYRGPRMTPFWRTVGSKPLGAYCNQGLECTTKICRYSRWCILT
eukprot:XP_017952151.1 PREDICTED: bone morphogenetic protein 15 isoform X2 [Xenopus tropicalis]